MAHGNRCCRSSTLGPYHRPLAPSPQPLAPSPRSRFQSCFQDFSMCGCRCFCVSVLVWLSVCLCLRVNFPRKKLTGCHFDDHFVKNTPSHKLTDTKTHRTTQYTLKLTHKDWTQTHLHTDTLRQILTHPDSLTHSHTPTQTDTATEPLSQTYRKTHTHTHTERQTHRHDSHTRTSAPNPLTLRISECYANLWLWFLKLN